VHLFLPEQWANFKHPKMNDWMTLHGVRPT
jgi:hypothetical protein